MRRTKAALARAPLIAAFFIATAASLTAAARAQIVYPYSAHEDKAATELQTSLAGAKTKQLAALDAHRTYLNAALQRDRQLVVDRVFAVRDRRILALMDRDGADRAAALKEEIDSRLSDILGTDAADSHALEKLPSFVADAAAARARIGIIGSSLDRAVALSGAKDSSDFCDSETGEPTAALAGAGDEIRTACSRIRREHQLLQHIGQMLGPRLQTLAGLGDAEALPRGSLLRSALEDVEHFRSLKKAQARLGAAAKDRLQKLQAYGKCQQELEQRGGNAAGIQKAAKALADLLKALAEWDKGDLKQLDDEAPLPQPEADDSCASALPQHPLLKVAFSDAELARVQVAIRALHAFSPARTVIAAADEKVQDLVSGELSRALSAVAEPSTAAKDDRNADIAGALVLLNADAEKVRTARAGKLPDVSAVSVRLAEAQLRQTTAKLEAARLDKLALLARQRSTAFTREAITLQRASNALSGPKPSFDRALLAYNDAWSKSHLSEEVLLRDMLAIQYTTWLARERAAVEAAYAMLDPAVTELRTYGAGGVKGSDVAGYVQAIGLGALLWK